MQSPLRILVNAIPLTNIHTGISRYLKCLYTRLEERYGKELEIWYFDGVKASRHMPEGPEDSRTWSRVVDLFWKLPAPVALMLRLALHFRRELAFRSAATGMDLYHEGGFFPFQAPPGVRVVFTLHDLSIYRFPQYHPRERVLYFKMFLRRRCRHVNHFLTVSHFSKREMISLLGIPEPLITVTPLAHDPEVFHPGREERSPLVFNGRELPEEFFLFVGSGDPRKNMEIIPAALDQARLQIPLVVVGWSGWLENHPHTHLLHLGYLSDEQLARVYRRAVALIFPSTYEGFGLPLLEAMACGCPVITTREASIPEVAGQAALFMNHPRDVRGLAELLQWIDRDKDLAKALRQKGLLQAGKFSWSATAAATMQVFRSCR